jgi:hypothetical protein
MRGGGKIQLPGSAEFLPDKARYRIQGSGANIWASEDAFQFVWKKVSGDLVFSMGVEWVGEGKVKHRKACAMVRQSLDADSPYVDVAVHGDGLIEMQYRKEKGAITMGVRTPIQAPATVKLERDGDVFTVSLAKNGGSFQPVGAMSLALPDRTRNACGKPAWKPSRLRQASADSAFGNATASRRPTGRPTENCFTSIGKVYHESFPGPACPTVACCFTRRRTGRR